MGLSLLFPFATVSAFTNDPVLLGKGVPALEKLTIALPVMGAYIIILGAFQAMGKAKYAFFLNMIRTFVKIAVMRDLGDEKVQKVVEAEASEIRELHWEKGLAKALFCLEKREQDLVTARKGAEWKVAVARHLRERFLAPHKWIAHRLCMGAPSSVQCLVSRHRKLIPGMDVYWERLNHE